jgi:kynurenine formamidase
METVPPIVGRAVVLDVAGHKDLAACPTATRSPSTTCERAWTGRASAFSGRRGAGADRQGQGVLHRRAAYQAGQPGVGVDAAVWLYEQGMAVLGTDTTGSEPLPFADANRTTHAAMLVDRGVHLLENLDLDAVSAQAISRGLFVCLPLRITGATGSWVRPVLIT